MYFQGLGTAAPATRYTQKQCYEALLGSPQYERLDRRSRALLQRLLLGDNGIETRHLALDPLTDAFDAQPDVLHRRFATHAPRIAQQAAEEAVRIADCRPHDIDGVNVSTCTGYLCPGLTSYVIEGLGLRRDVVALDLVGQGCGAAIPNLRTAEALLVARRCDRVLSICVEVCSAAFYIDDDPGVLVSACLFGDGAGAAVVGREPVAGHPSPRWTFSASHTEPAARDVLRFEQKDGMLRNILTPEVPQLAAEYAERVLDETLRDRGLTRESIAAWVWHAGGRKVLDALQRQLGLDAHDVRYSTQVLRTHANVSSACVYFELNATIHDGARP